jgi:N-acetylneuraminic acid mutarotase
MTKLYSLTKNAVLAAILCVLTIGSLSAQWTKVDAPTPMTTYNSLHTQVYLNGVLYMFGGAPGLSQPTAEAWSLDTKSPGAQWKALAPMPTARISAYAAAVNGKIYIMGGWYQNGNARVVPPQVLEYDPAANTYETKASMTSPSYFMAGAVVENKIFVMGGIINNAYSNSTQVYDPATDKWAASTASTLSSGHATASAIDNVIYLIGGNTSATAYFKTVLKGTVTGTTITWKKMGDFPIFIAGAASGVANGTLYVAGGVNAEGVRASVYKYDAVKDKWAASFQMPVASDYTRNMVGDGTALYYIHGEDNPDTYKFVEGAPTAIMYSTPNDLDYKLKTGTSGQKTISISNFGTLPLTVQITTPAADKWLTTDAGELAIDPGQMYEVTLFANSTGMAAGKYTSAVTLTSDDPKNAKVEIPLKLQLADITVKRLPLLEVFTSSTCGPCKPGNERLNTVITPIDRSNYTVLKYQQDFPGTGDPYATNETINRRGFYGINSIPRMEVDGGWDGNASSFTKGILDDATSQVCLLSWQANYTVTNNTVQVTATIDPQADYTDKGMRLYVAILEKNTVKNVKSNGETEFEDVVKKMLPDENGTALDAMLKGEKVTKTFEYTFPGKYRLPNDGQAANRIKVTTENSVEDMDNLEVIVWAQNSITKEVYNSGWAVLGPVSVMEDLQSASSLTLGQNYPNPASGNTTIAYSTPKAGNAVIELYNILGAKVATPVNNFVNEGVNSVTFNTESLPTGVYTVYLRINGQSVSKTLTVVHAN